MKVIRDQFSSKFDDKQFGYRRKSSTTCALLDMENFITDSLQDKDVIACHIISVDLSKGFDKVPHNLLLEKMMNNNFDPFVLSFMSNYLTMRFQRMSWRGSYSNYTSVCSGIPQGSSIGPLGFGFFMADLSLSDYKDLTLIKYADDIVAIGKIKKDALSSPVINAQKNKMVISDQKSQQMFVSTRDTSMFLILRFLMFPQSNI